eukprot:NODE_19472_length_842_cov_3.190210.p2 GENE.NODE_19472_length_842_cov_3.190210~~NODE_19472_length_842_cov_3.190210.p2  ORF type:complete len:188 (-),score=20.36 NODE_19472_length_842_cov_3.190210:89-652(-)
MCEAHTQELVRTLQSQGLVPDRGGLPARACSFSGICRASWLPALHCAAAARRSAAVMLPGLTPACTAARRPRCVRPGPLERNSVAQEVAVCPRGALGRPLRSLATPPLPVVAEAQMQTAANTAQRRATAERQRSPPAAEDAAQRGCRIKQPQAVEGLRIARPALASGLLAVPVMRASSPRPCVVLQQ